MSYTFTPNIPYGADSLQFVNLYRQTGTPKGTIIRIHGGSWRSTNLDPSPTVESASMATLANQGWTVIDVNYRGWNSDQGSNGNGQFPNNVYDVQTVLDYCFVPGAGTAQSTVWDQISNDIQIHGNLIVTGNSAGGHLAILAVVGYGAGNGNWPTAVLVRSAPLNLDYNSIFIDTQIVNGIITNYVPLGQEQNASPYYMNLFGAINASITKFYFNQNDYDTLSTKLNISGPTIQAFVTNSPNNTIATYDQVGPPLESWPGTTDVTFLGSTPDGTTATLPSSGQTLGDAYIANSQYWVYNAGTFAGDGTNPASINGFTRWFDHNYIQTEEAYINQYASMAVAPVAANSSTTVLINSSNNLVGPDVIYGPYDSITIVTAPVNGNTSGTDNTSIYYTPNANFFGGDSIVYTVSNSTGTSTEAVITIDVVGTPPVSQVPVTAYSNVTVNFLSSLNPVGPNVISGTYDSISIIVGPVNGNLSGTDATTIYYTPDPTFHGTDIISYTVSNSSGTSAIAEITVTVTTPTLTVVPASGVLPSGVIRSPYTIVLETVGGTAPYSVVGGTWPAWLTLTDNVLSGTPTVANNYSFNVQITDSSNPPIIVEASYSIDITLPTIELTVTPDVVEGGPVYVTWSVQYAADSVINLSNASGTFSLLDQPLVGAATFTAPSTQIFDTVTAELRNRSPSTFVNSVSKFYSVIEVLKPLTGPLPSSKYTQTSKQWDKSPITVFPKADQKQWGLYRSYIGSPVPNWGSDSIQDTEGTVKIDYNGRNVDVVIIGRGSPNRTHPEFSDNEDGSRVKYYNWFQWNSTVNGSVPNGTYADASYYSQDANAACAVASIVAGNEYGWARGANIYSLDYTLIPSTADEATAMARAFKYVTLFHQNKSISTVTGVKNPTVVITSSMLYKITDPSTTLTIDYRGAVQGPSTFSTSTLESYSISTPYSDISDSRIFTTYDSPEVTTAVTECIGNGIIVVGPAGDFSNYVDIDGGLDYNNTITDPTGTWNYNRGTGAGSAPGVICVGAADSIALEQKANFSGVGPRVDLFAPGTDLMVAMNSKLGIPNDIVGETPPVTKDPRNDSFYLGKVSGTVYAAAQVAGFLACLVQLQPSLTPTGALSYVTTNAGVNQLSTGTEISVTTSVQLYTSHNAAYCEFLNTYGVWPNQDLTNPAGYGDAGKTTVTFNFNAPLASSGYTLYISADNDMQVYLNGDYSSNFVAAQSYYAVSQYDVTLQEGKNVLQCVVFNYHGPGSLGVLIVDAFSNQVFATSANLNIATPESLGGTANLYLFGTFPIINERITGVPSVATNQQFDINVSGGTPNGAFNYTIKNVTTGTGFLNKTGSAVIVNQSFDTPGIKNYEFTFINSTNKVNYSVEVIAHNENEIVSSFTQTSKFWNKTPEYIIPEPEWLNWGLLRSTTSTTIAKWGSDSVIVNAEGTVTIPYTGLNVDIVILDSGSVDPSHPEFALYSDGTGDSRVKNYNWLKFNFSLLGLPNGSYDDSTYYKSIESNRASAIAGIAAGNTYGWARAANIYSLNYNLLPNGSNNIEQAFDYITAFHNDKKTNAVNPVTGFANPTLVIAGWATHQVISFNNIQQVDFQANGPDTSFTIEELAEYGILAPYSSAGNTSTYVTVRNAAIDAAVDTAIGQGVIIVSTPGDYASYVAKDSSDINWTNRILDNTNQPFYYAQGASPGAATGVICVGAVDSSVSQQKAGYSGNGPRVDVFAPGSDQISAESSVVGIYSDIVGAFAPTYPDPRNNNYYIGKNAGTAYAAANVAGYAACLLQLYPNSSAADILNLITDAALLNELAINDVGFGVNNNLNGAPNRLLQGTFPDYNEIIYTVVNGSSSTFVTVGDNFDFQIVNADPGTRYSYSGTGSGSGTIDQYGRATASTIALKNTGRYVYKFYFASTNHTQVLSFQVNTTRVISNKDIIYANDYDRIQNRVKYLLDDIYGVTPQSVQKTPGVLVAALEWQDLYADIQSAYIHQNGSEVSFPLSYAQSGSPNKVTAEDLNKMTNVVDDLINDYEVAGPGQVIFNSKYDIETITTAVYESHTQLYDWTGSSARNFFNLGGYIEVSFDNTILGKQTSAFTLTDYISSYGYISLPIPGGYVNNIMTVDSVNGNQVTIDTIIAPNMGNTAFATGTVKIYASTAATGGIASPLPVSSFDPVRQGQLNVTPIRYVSIYGNSITTATFNVFNNYGSDITVSEVRINSDPNRKPLNMVVNTPVPFVVSNTYNLSISFQNVEPGGDPGLYANSIELISDGPNPLLTMPVPVQANFGIVVKPNPYFSTVSKATTTTFEIVSYAGTFSNYTVIATTASVGFQVINPGINYTYYTLDDTLGKTTMLLLLYNNLFQGRRAPSTAGALSSPYSDSILVTDVGAIPNVSTSTQLQFIAYPKDITQNAATALVDVEMLIDSEDYHIGHWLSPQNQMNGVVGFSYDVIDGQRCLTVGFGMGSGGSTPLYQSDRLFSTTEVPEIGYGIYSSTAIQQLGRKFYSYITTGTVSAAIGGWNTATVNTSTFNTYTEILVYTPEELVPLSTSSNVSNAFLATYGVWNGESSSATTYISTGTFLARDGGDYTYYFNCAARSDGNAVSASFAIDDGAAVSSITEPSGIVKGTIKLTPGLHDVKINAQQTGGVSAISAVALTIINYDGYVVWCTLDSMLPTWAEIGRIYLNDDGKPHSYQVIPNVYTSNIAANTTYASYFANNSVVTVNDNGHGQLSIALNPIVSPAYESITDATLSNIPYLFYYYSNTENQIEGNKRFNNYQAAGQYVRYFTGFDPYGNVTTVQKLAPGYIAPPLVLTQYYASGKKKPLWQQVASDLLLIGIVLYGIYAIGVALGVIVAVIEIGASVYGWAAFSYWLTTLLPAATCFTEDTEVTMEDGSIKQISEVQVGDRVYNFDKTAINEVKHLEVVVNKELVGMYSPDKEHAPFATINHPLYINGVLSSVLPKATYDAYPWLGKTAQAPVARSGPMQPGVLMYNLWVDGDGTYIVNGYGTTSIIGDGGALGLGIEYNAINRERVTELFDEFISEGPETAFGGYLFNKYLGKIKFKPLIKLVVTLFKQPSETKFRQNMNKVFKFVGKHAIKRQEKQSNK